MTAVTAQADVLALQEGSDGAGLIAFAVVAALFVAGWFLYRSLSRHLHRIDFADRPADRPADQPGGSADRPAGGGQDPPSQPQV